MKTLRVLLEDTGTFELYGEGIVIFPQFEAEIMIIDHVLEGIADLLQILFMNVKTAAVDVKTVKSKQKQQDI